MTDDSSLHAPPPPREDVEALLDRIRPGLIADGGNIELLGIDGDGTVRVVFQGECADCPAQLATLKVAVAEPLRHAIDGISAVVAV
jgi:Fe-S cluster biogenesis protein NfuA